MSPPPSFLPLLLFPLSRVCRYGLNTVKKAREERDARKEGGDANAKLGFKMMGEVC